MRSRYFLLLAHGSFILIFLLAAACKPFTKSHQSNTFSYLAPQAFIQPVAFAPANGATKLLTTSHYSSSLWPQMRRNFQLHVNTSNPQVRKYIRYYTKNQAQLNRTLTRARPFIYLVTQELKRRNMPAELALLPIIESAYNPHAHSSANATGLWQIMPATARHLGLKKNSFYDGRKDVRASTYAALNYLQYLHRFFHGDWELAIAAYNSGEGNVQKAQRRNRNRGRATDFWHLGLPNETKQYVPNFLALAAIFSNPAQYNIHLIDIPNKPYLAGINIKKSLSFKKAANLANININELYKINPGLNRYANSAPSDYTLMVPAGKAKIVETKLAMYLSNSTLLAKANNPLLTKKTLKKITRKTKTTTVLAKANTYKTSKKLSNVKIKTKTIKLAKAKTKIVKAKTSKHIHVVHRGESLWTISHKYGVSWQKLRKWNAISTRGHIYPGQRIVVWRQV